MTAMESVDGNGLQPAPGERSDEDSVSGQPGQTEAHHTAAREARPAITDFPSGARARRGSE